MAEPLQINESASVTLNAAGAGTARLGPGRAGVRWDVRTAAVSVDTSISEPTVGLYLGEPSSSSFLGGSYSGSNDSTDVRVTLWSGQYLTAVWAGGDPGSRATMTVLGEKRV